jgi:DNA-binding CsgD family transcriptional regulator
MGMARLARYAQAVHDMVVGVDDDAIAMHDRFGLSAREVDVLRLIIQGSSDREIGTALSISPRTVGSHVSNILGKLGTRTRTEAAAMAVRNDLV